MVGTEKVFTSDSSSDSAAAVCSNASAVSPLNSPTLLST